MEKDLKSELVHLNKANSNKRWRASKEGGDMEETEETEEEWRNIPFKSKVSPRSARNT